ncbi:MAG: hypothetical protein ACOY3Y_02540, partial [Acidobacteriota bacterium]
YAVFCLLLAALAAPTALAEDDRRPSGVYVPDPGQEEPALAAPAAAESVPLPAEPAGLDARRARRLAQLEMLAAAALASTDESERLRLEDEMVRIKREGDLEDLQLKLAAAEAGGFAEQAARLAQALRELKAPRAPVAPGATVPRDPATGEALGVKGGVR